MQIDIFETIFNQFLVLENEINKTKEELLTILNKKDIDYQIEVIDKYTKNECIFIYFGKRKRVQFILYNNKVSNAFLEVYDASYFIKGKKSRNNGIDNFIKIIDKENIHWEIKKSFNKEIVLKTGRILFYFDYDLKYPLYKIGYNIW